MFNRYNMFMTHERFYNRKLKKLNDQLQSRIDFQGEHIGFKIVEVMIKQASYMVEGTNTSLEKRKEINAQIRAIETKFYPMVRG